MSRTFCFILLVIISTGCFEEDNRVPPYPGEVTTIDHDITYWQSYFDLETNQVVSLNSIGEWDMAFGSSPDSWHLRINSAKGLFVYRSEPDDAGADYHISGNERWSYDKSDGNPDSSAFGNWCDTLVYPHLSKGEIFIIGKTDQESYSVYAQVQLLSVDSAGYIMKYRKTGEQDIHQVDIIKTDSVHFVYYDFETGVQKYLEPALTRYDIVFTPYYDLVYDIVAIPLPYLVRGVILNSSNVFAAMETLKTFNEITWFEIDTSGFTCEQDFIGWEWKDVNIDFSGGTANYNVHTDQTYLIKSFERNYYKLRFLSYYLDGVYGFPSFEYKLLTPLRKKSY
jgi:hypothetical protein